MDWSVKRVMNAPRVVKLISTSDGAGSKDARFELYCSLLREFIEPVFGWDEGFQRRRFETEYPDENTRLVQADGAIAGYSVITTKPDTLHLSLLLLRPDFQRMGVGREVIDQIARIARSDGKGLSLSCFKANVRARLFYESLGFVVSSEDADSVMMVRGA